VTHGGVLDSIYRFARALPLQAPREWPLLNASVNVVDFEAGAARIVSWADVAHLGGQSADDNLKKAP
jgi:probable phosphoglycerate mutase